MRYPHPTRAGGTPGTQPSITFHDAPGVEAPADTPAFGLHNCVAADDSERDALLQEDGGVSRAWSCPPSPHPSTCISSAGSSTICQDIPKPPRASESPRWDGSSHCMGFSTLAPSHQAAGGTWGGLGDASGECDMYQPHHAGDARGLVWPQRVPRVLQDDVSSWPWGPAPPRTELEEPDPPSTPGPAA